MGSLHAVRRMRASSCARLRWLRGLRGCGERAAVRPCAALLRPWREAGPELARQRSGHGVACLAAIILLTTKTLLSRKRPAQLATQLASLESSLLPATGGMRMDPHLDDRLLVSVRSATSATTGGPSPLVVG